MPPEVKGGTEIQILPGKGFQNVEGEFSGEIFLIAVCALQIAAVQNLPLKDMLLCFQCRSSLPDGTDQICAAHRTGNLCRYYT